MTPVALTIAGSDPSGGAGIQADLKTFHHMGVYGEAVVTLVTVQNTRTVSRIEVLAADLVAQQIHAVLEDIPPGAIKTGALGNAPVIEAVSAELAGVTVPILVDPVMISKHGAPLMSADARDVFLQLLLPRAFLLTPNLAEASSLTGRDVRSVEDMHEAARALADCGPLGVLVKGGHLNGAAIDVLCFEGAVTEFPGPRFETRHTHGTGCTYSAAITACLSRGFSLSDSIAAAKQFITRAIETNPGLGAGCGPVNHFADYR